MPGEDVDAEREWLQEAERRYQACRSVYRLRSGKRLVNLPLGPQASALPFAAL